MTECRVNGLGNLIDWSGCLVIGDASHKLVRDVGEDDAGVAVDVVPVLLDCVVLKLLEVHLDLITSVFHWEVFGEGSCKI